MPFRKVAFLSQMKSTITCPNCQTVLEGDRQQLGTIGAITGGMAGLLSCVAVLGLRYSVLSLTILLGSILVLFVGAVIQNRVLRLRPVELKE